MESLGGDQRWSDRFLAQHSAVLYFWVGSGMKLRPSPPLEVLYFWVLVALWLLSPTLA